MSHSQKMLTPCTSDVFAGVCVCKALTCSWNVFQWFIFHCNVPYVENVIWFLLANFAAWAIQTFSRCEQSYWRDGTLSGTINLCHITEYIISLSGASEKHNFGILLKCLINQHNVTQHAGIPFVVFLIIIIFVVNISVTDIKCASCDSFARALWFYSLYLYCTVVFFSCCGIVVCQWNTIKWNMLGTFYFMFETCTFQLLIGIWFQWTCVLILLAAKHDSRCCSACCNLWHWLCLPR